MSKATKAFSVWDSEQGKSASFEPGDPVPDHIASEVGLHVIDKAPDSSTSDEDVDTSAFSGEAFDAAVEARATQLAEEQSAAAVEEYKAREQAAYNSATEGDEFNPDEVKAQEVKSYLEGLDRETVIGSAEYDRVAQAERDGQNRSSAFPKDDAAE